MTNPKNDDQNTLKSSRKTKLSNTKSQNEYDDGQDEPQKWQRYCNEAEETQEHIRQECMKIMKGEETIKYTDIFKENNIKTNWQQSYSQNHKRNQPQNKWKPINREPEASAPNEMVHLVYPGTCKVCIHWGRGFHLLMCHQLLVVEALLYRLWSRTRWFLCEEGTIEFWQYIHFPLVLSG